MIITPIILIVKVKGGEYMVVFDKLWILMKKKGISTYKLREHCGIDSKTIRRLKANQNIVKLTLSGEIKTLPEKSFYNCPSLKTVIIKDKLTHIGPSAFENCTSLETVQIGNGVTLIDKFAFNNCTSLKNLTLGNKVQTIEMYAFKNCSSLTSIVIPASARLIKESSFWDCYNLTDVEFKSPNNWGPDVDDADYTYDLTDKQARITLLLHGLGFRKH